MADFKQGGHYFSVRTYFVPESMTCRHCKLPFSQGLVFEKRECFSFLEFPKFCWFTGDTNYWEAYPFLLCLVLFSVCVILLTLASCFSILLLSRRWNELIGSELCSFSICYSWLEWPSFHPVSYELRSWVCKYLY